jgi:Cu(I)/Ag(I) efflux system membrane protein CusA/SilA
VRTDERGAPSSCVTSPDVQMGGEIRRGAAEWTVTAKSSPGIVVMRYGENALDVIERVEKKIEELRPSLPDGVEIVPVYDRSG